VRVHRSRPTTDPRFFAHCATPLLPALRHVDAARAVLLTGYEIAPKYRAMLARIVATVALTTGLLAGAAACSHSHATPAPTAPNISDVALESAATDEALLAMLAAAPLTSQRVAVLAPVEGSVPRSTVLTFSWSEPQTAIRLSPAVQPSVQSAPTMWWEQFALEGTAHAHGTPTSGFAYFLVVTGSADAPLLRVFTTKKQYEPTADQWVKLLAAKGAMRAQVTAAFFEDNRVVAGGGPFASPPVNFTIAAQ
jgi:hypothetical protein